MTEDFFSWTIFRSMPLVGIMRHIPILHAENIFKAFCASGLTTIEITIDSPGFEESMHLARSVYKGKLNIGAGTVCTIPDLKKALSAGAQFIVTPVVEATVIKACKKKNIPVFPGAYTPTEIYTAWKYGADLVKVFPAIAQATEYIRSIKGPFPKIRLLPTGGVHIDNCVDLLQAGAEGLGIGSGLFNDAVIHNEYYRMEAHFSAFAQKIRQYLSVSSAADPEEIG